MALEINIKGEKGEKGEKGDQGVKGNSFLSGRGVPTDYLGVNGDTYLDLSTGNVYSKKQNTWL